MIIATVSVFMAAFVACAVAHITLSLQVRRALMEQHPAAWAAQVERMAANPRGTIGNFVWSGRHRELGDPELTRRVLLIRGLTAGLVVSMLGAIFGWMPIEAILGGPSTA